MVPCSASQDMAPTTSANPRGARRQQRQRPDRRHGLRAVDERHRLLRTEHQRLDWPAGERRCPDARPFASAFPFADQHQRQVRERREVPAGAHAALRGTPASPRGRAARERARSPARARPSIPWRASWRAAASWRASPESRAALRRRPRASAQIQLHSRYLSAGDANVAQLADASGYRVRNFIVRDERVHDGASAVDRFARIEREQHGPVLDRHFARGFKRQVATVDVQGFQEQFQFPSSQFQVVRSSRSPVLSRASPLATRYSSIFIPAAARKAFLYFSGKDLGFMFESATMWVVSPSASSSPLPARNNSYPK